MNKSMNIIIENCNNIINGEICIEKNKLNIKYGANGTGKSTIAKAIESRLSGRSEAMDDLLPFALRENNKDKKRPSVEGLEGIKNIKIFNDVYLEQFIFKPDELIQNSFEIFINSPEHQAQLQAINEIIGKIKSTFTEDKNLEKFLADLRKLSESFKITKTGVSKSSTGYKALEGGNKCTNIPEGLESYKPFLEHSSNVTWIGWQQQGQSFLEISDNCPFCTSLALDKQETIKRVAKEYDKNTIKHLVGLIEVLSGLGQYFSEETRIKLENITQNKSGLQKEHEDFICEVKKQIDNLINKLDTLKNIGLTSFKDSENIEDKIPELQIDLTFFDRLSSEATHNIIQSLNNKLGEINSNSQELQKAIGVHRRKTKELIGKNLKNINDFLNKAGYKYQVTITNEEDGHRLRLMHKEHQKTLMGGKQHLSFGERNAFAFVLFMFECLSKSTDLVILDDPISSFDKDKKFALLDMLFTGKKSFKGKTVLMLTHDIDPLIDTIKVLHSRFSSFTNAHFLKTKNGILSERSIANENILTFTQICNLVIKSEKPTVVKLIYFRRYLEVIGEMSDCYEVLSNIFKKRKPPEDHRVKNDEGGFLALSEESLCKGVSEIKEKLHLSNFDYNSTVNELLGEKNLCNLYKVALNGYEKIQIYRLIDDSHKNSVVRKYINEAYHIENDLVCQLNPTEFDPIPQFVIDECDRFIEDLIKNNGDNP